MKFHVLKKFVKPISIVVCVGVVLVAAINWQSWFPETQKWVESTVASFRSGTTDEEHAEDTEDPHAGHDHADHAGHDDASSLELSKQALGNIGLTSEYLQPVKLETFRKEMTVPAIVVERPGRTRVQVATPLTGVVMHVHVLEGEAIEPGTLLFQIRLTHEDLVQSQTDFLRTLGELDVEDREIARLQDVTNSGAVAKKVLLEREYAKDKLMAHLDAQKEALKLHGLSDHQVDKIAEDRKLLRELQIFAPSADGHPEDELKLTEGLIRRVSFQPTGSGSDESEIHGPLILQKLDVHKGQSLSAGETLCILADYDELYIQGMAFEQDIARLRSASRNDWKVTAVFDQSYTAAKTVEDLEIAYLSNEIHTDSRTLHFYVDLQNEMISDKKLRGTRYIEWKYFPGQRLQLRIPIEELSNQIVLPVDSVAREGAEYFVFQQNGDHFDRVPVHVVYRDQFSVVIANDGSLFPGDIVALRGAHQMQMALKNKSGGAVDPHAGHSH
jgi:membrane fusion protein, heavy metal efflux system